MTKEEKCMGDQSINVIISTEIQADVKIDVEQLAKGIQTKLDCNLSMPLNCSIFQVPTILSRHSPTSYAPNQFSIGPFHHHNQTLKRTERIKWKYLRDLLSRLSKKTSLPDLSKTVCDVWDQAREYYAGPITMEPAEFVEVLVLDGCFLIELFRKKEYVNLRTGDDPIFTMPCLIQFLMHDLILLENQVPWMVLEKLFDMTSVALMDTMPLAKLALNFFNFMFSNKSQLSNNLDNSLLTLLQGSKHILDLLRNSLISPFDYTKLKGKGDVAAMHSATFLEAYGIKFRQCESKSILDIKFCKKTGVLDIPQLFIQESTKTVFRNLIALEQCCPNYDPVVTCYAVLLDNLINTRKDMEILCESKAVETWLNVAEASKFFDKLYIGTRVKEGFYLQITKDVRGYCKKSWPRYMKTLRRDYFSHPWALISFVAAFIALILTILQTVYSIKETTSGKKN